jgi:nucleoside-diphosphate-sugar epimerase
MQQNRPQQQRLIYISTTGVYPRQPGLWNEDMPLRPDSPSGQLRLQTEQVLCEFFKVQVVRPGGIYGPGRNLVERLKAGKGIPETPKLTHRIHVCDLAGIVAWLVQHPEGPGCVNAVDQEARSSWEVAEWLVQHHPELNPEMLPEQSKSVLPENAPERRIDNQRLLREMDYKLRFPTFREGMRPH